MQVWILYFYSHVIFIYILYSRYRLAFRQTLLCRTLRRTDSHHLNLEHTSCRDVTPLPSLNKPPHYRRRDQRISFISKVDYVKDPSPYCIAKDGEVQVLNYYNDVNKVYLSECEISKSDD